jgi:NAD(P)-dependent dehydrogenase (short-subunit alcohol dehydrogenase family)
VTRNVGGRSGAGEGCLEGRGAIVTGATRGLGSRIAGALWDEGASLLLVARPGVALDEAAGRLPRRSGQRIATIGVDLATPGAAGQVVAAAAKELGSVDVLVNDAAIQGPIGPVWTNDWDAWVSVIQVDLLAPVALCRACVPLMAKRGGGKIVNLSGGGATGPRPRFSAYAAAKAGLVRFSETLAEETKDLSIDVNCVAPGPMATSMTEEVLRSGPSAAGLREHEAALRTKKEGEGALDRAVRLCVFLASPRSDGITGRLISAVWDPWEELPGWREELMASDVYTLRRIVPKDRGKA